MYETHFVRVTGSGTLLLGKLEPTTAMKKKGTKQKKCKNSCAVPCNTRGLVVGAVVSSKSYTKRDQLTSSAHDPAVMMSWRVLLEEFRKLRKVRLLPRGFLN